MDASSSSDDFEEVPVYAGVLRATAELLDTLGTFLADADPATRARLASFLTAHHGAGAADPEIEVALLVGEVNEAANLLSALSHGTPAA